MNIGTNSLIDLTMKGDIMESKNSQYVVGLLDSIKKCNSDIARINQENERNRGSKEIIKKQILAEAEKYMQAYGVQLVYENDNGLVVDEELINNEFESVCRDAEENIAKMTKMLDLISQKRYDELNLLIGGEKTTENQKQNSLRNHGVNHGSVTVTSVPSNNTQSTEQAYTQSEQQSTINRGTYTQPAQNTQPVQNTQPTYTAQTTYQAQPSQQEVTSSSRYRSTPTQQPITPSQYQQTQQGQQPPTSGVQQTTGTTRRYGSPTPPVASTQSSTQRQYSALTSGTRFQNNGN